ncbi:MAG TPA: DNA polymerase III subunit delta' [Sphingomicrobium sp.]|nr:DNA polymerase III subunit delta' [Sphingomicrobium sp.]
MIAGHDRQVEQFRGAWDSRALHHAWLLAGPRGVGKAHFARLAAVRLLAEAAGPVFEAPRLDTPEDHSTAKLVRAGSHPDLRLIERIENPKKPGTLFRDILVDQIRDVAAFLSLSPALSDWRVVVIDSADELAPAGANALLKMLEEPPPNTVFFVVSHAPGRLLPTIRSRCRRLQFDPLPDDAMTSVLAEQLPETSAAERERLIPLADGSAARALAFASLDLGPIEEKAASILRDGDADNSKRSALAGELGRKTAADRYSAFLDLLPSLVAREARTLADPKRERALDAYQRVRELTATAPRLSLDPAATVFQLGGILASVAGPRRP